MWNWFKKRQLSDIVEVMSWNEISALYPEIFYYSMVSPTGNHKNEFIAGEGITIKREWFPDNANERAMIRIVSRGYYIYNPEGARERRTFTTAGVYGETLYYEDLGYFERAKNPHKLNISDKWIVKRLSKEEAANLIVKPNGESYWKPSFATSVDSKWALDSGEIPCEKTPLRNM